MRITYLLNDILQRLTSGLTPNEKQYYDRWLILPDKFHLTFGKDYVVYGIEYTKEGYVNFIIVDDTEVNYLKTYPSEFFKVKDNRLSKYWIGNNGDYYPIVNINYPSIISFKELTQDQYFLGNLLDCENNSQQIFNKYKELIDNEFPDENLKLAEIIDENWVFCNYCGEAWENNSKEGIIICPKCYKRNNNPQFDRGCKK